MYSPVIPQTPMKEGRVRIVDRRRLAEVAVKLEFSEPTWAPKKCMEKKTYDTSCIELDFVGNCPNAPRAKRIRECILIDMIPSLIL